MNLSRDEAFALVERAVRNALTKEREEVDALLAKRLEECFCAPPLDDSGVPCASCMEVARVRGTLQARAKKP